jgi:hypothetical protein
MIPNGKVDSSSIVIFTGSSLLITQTLGNKMVSIAGTSNGSVLPNLEIKAWTEGFKSPAGIKFAHDKILKAKIEQAFKEGRAINLMSDDYQTEIKDFVTNILNDYAFVLSLARKIANITPGARGKELQDRVKSLFSKYSSPNVSDEEKSKILSELKSLLIDQTRFIGLNFGENGNDPYLFNIGDITSEEHRAIVAHVGTFAYPGSENVTGGPRTIYLSMARISGYRNLGQEGIKAFQELIMHEFTDLIAGKHIVESLPTLIAANLRINQMYKNDVVQVVQGTKRGVPTYDTGKVYKNML